MLRWINLGRASCCLILCVTGCQSQSQNAAPLTGAPSKLTIIKRIKDIEKLDAASQLRQAVAAGDKRFMAIGGVGTEVPGVTNGIANALVEQHGTHLIEGTTDFIQVNEQGRLNSVARRYAQYYNKLLLDHLANQKSK